MFVLVLCGTCYSCRVTGIAVAAKQKYVYEKVYRFYRMGLFRANFRKAA